MSSPTINGTLDDNISSENQPEKVDEGEAEDDDDEVSVIEETTRVTEVPLIPMSRLSPGFKSYLMYLKTHPYPGVFLDENWYKKRNNSGFFFSAINMSDVKQIHDEHVLLAGKKKKVLLDCMELYYCLTMFVLKSKQECLDSYSKSGDLDNDSKTIRTLETVGKQIKFHYFMVEELHERYIEFMNRRGERDTTQENSGSSPQDTPEQGSSNSSTTLQDPASK